MASHHTKSTTKWAIVSMRRRPYWSGSIHRVILAFEKGHQHRIATPKQLHPHAHVQDVSPIQIPANRLPILPVEPFA